MGSVMATVDVAAAVNVLSAGYFRVLPIICSK